MTTEATAPDRLGGPASLSIALGRLAPGSQGGLASLVAVVSLVLFATAQYCRQMSVDTYFDLYAGRYVAQHGIPERNALTVLAHGKPWVDQQWLAQLIFFRTWQLGGYAAVTLLSVALVAAGSAVLGALMLRRGVSPLATCAWTLAAIAVSYGYATARAQSFGYLFLPLVPWLVLRDEERTRPQPRTWLSIPLLAVWANVHGSVLIGAGFVGLYAECRAWGALRRRDARGLMAYLALGAAAAAALICTPYGFGIARYYARLIGNPELSRNVAEWAPLGPSSPDFWAFSGVVVAIAVAVAVGWRRGVRPAPDLTIFAVITLGVAVIAVRNTPWFGFAGCLLAADMLAGRWGVRATALIFRRMLAAALAAWAVVVVIGLALEPAGQYGASMPRQAIDVAARLADGRPRVPVLADQFSAVGLLWLHPALLSRVAFDVRVEQYDQAQLAAIFDFMAAGRPNWQRLLHGYDLVVLSRERHPRLAGTMTRLAGWRVVYADDRGVVLERDR